MCIKLVNYWDKFPLFIYCCNESSLSDDKTVKHSIRFPEFSFYISHFHSRVTSKSLLRGGEKISSTIRVEIELIKPLIRFLSDWYDWPVHK